MQKIVSASLVRIFFILNFMFSFMGPVPSLCEGAEKESPGRVAFLPFTTHAAKDMSYLKDGIRDMLASRLSANAGIIVIDKALVDKALAAGLETSPEKTAKALDLLELGKRLQADYLVTGSITALGVSMSLDAKVIAIADPATPHTFYATAATEDSVIPAINQLASDISGKIFNRPPPDLPAAKTPQAPPVPEPAKPLYQTAHPERAFMGPVTGTGPSLLGPYSKVPGFTKSQTFQFGLQGIDVGDVDGDGADDIVLAAGSDVMVFHRSGNRFNQFGKISLTTRYKVHAISLADLNNNGKNEIYISAADAGDPYSFGVEWRDNDFDFLFKKTPWFIKAVNLPGQGMVLAGQRAGFNKPLEPGIYQLIGNTSQTIQGPLQKGQQLPVPGFVNIFSFVLADISGDGEAEIIFINQEDYLNVLRQSGKLLWQSSGLYGGTTRYIGKEAEIDEEFPDNALQPEKGKKIFVPPRLISVDINNDGLMDVIVNRNQLRWSPVLKNLKNYKSGHIVGLTWNGISLTELWHTKKVDGYITDYQFKIDKGNTNEAHLYVGLILTTGSLNILKAKESTVLMYDLTFGDDEEVGK